MTPLPIEFNIPPELEHAEPPVPPEGDPSTDLQQPRFLYPNRVPMLFFHLLRPAQYHPSHPHHSLPGHTGANISNSNSPAPHLNSQPIQTMNKLTPSSRVNQLPPTFVTNNNNNNSSMTFE